MSSSKSFNLTLIRHGQTTHNKLKIVQGQMETHLTDLGRHQAKQLQAHYEKTSEKFDKVYSSDLIRAYETCQIICNGKYDIIKNQLLRERCFGVLQGSPLSELREAAYKAGYDDSNFTKFRPEGGETAEEVLERMRKFCLDELFPKSVDQSSILIVTHGGVIREFFKLFRELGCQISNAQLVISPNTGISRFKIKVNNKNKVDKIEPTSLHEIPHLTCEAKDEALNEEQLNESGMKKKEVEYAI